MSLKYMDERINFILLSRMCDARCRRIHFNLHDVSNFPPQRHFDVG